jgi:hypothetical protein
VTAYQRLKDLLLDDERAERARADQRIDALERGRLTPQDLPGLVEAAGQGDTAPRLARALAAPVAGALGDAVVKRRQTIVDALFPVIGPAIRKAIAESMRAMVADLNAAIESSLTPRGLRWRLEAWRTGAPYAQVVLRHTLRWRIEHLFLIEPDAGLVIHHQSAPGLPELDSDAIAGMLTAIGDFVQDSVGRATGATLASADVGEHLLWVEDGPRARLACFIRGAPPAALRTVLRQRLEQIHARFADPLAQLQAGAADVGAALDRALDLPGLEGAARAVDDAPPVARARWPAILLGIALAGALLAWGVQQWRWSQREAAVAALLADWPGLAVQDIARESGGLRVRALLDPLADPPQTAVAALLPADTPLVFDTRGYLATDALIVERRARGTLALPAGVALALVDGVLRLDGELPEGERTALLARAALVPGVVAVDASALRASEPRLRAEFDALRARVEARRIAFDGDAEQPADAAAADPLLDDLRALLAAARPLGLEPVLRTHGGTDDSGTPARNAALRAARARWLAERIATALTVEVEIEIAVGVLAEDAGSAATLEGRSAAVVVDLGEGQRR